MDEGEQRDGGADKCNETASYVMQVPRACRTDYSNKTVTPVLRACRTDYSNLTDTPALRACRIGYSHKTVTLVFIQRLVLLATAIRQSP